MAGDARQKRKRHADGIGSRSTGQMCGRPGQGQSPRRTIGNVEERAGAHVQGHGLKVSFHPFERGSCGADGFMLPNVSLNYQEARDSGFQYGCLGPDLAAQEAEIETYLGRNLLLECVGNLRKQHVNLRVRDIHEIAQFH